MLCPNQKYTPPARETSVLQAYRCTCIIGGGGLPQSASAPKSVAPRPSLPAQRRRRRTRPTSRHARSRRRPRRPSPTGPPPLLPPRPHALRPSARPDPRGPHRHPSRLSFYLYPYFPPGRLLHPPDREIFSAEYNTHLVHSAERGGGVALLITN